MDTYRKMPKKEFKASYSFYRRKRREALGTTDTATLEWVQDFRPLPSVESRDVLALRAMGKTFAHPKNRRGSYGWGWDFTLGH